MSIRKRSDREYSAHLQGTLDLLILRTLVLGRQHGQGIARAIQDQSDNVLIVDHGSLYPALQRLESIISEGVAAKEIKPILPYIAVLTILSAVRGLEFWHRSQKSYSPEELEENMVAYLIGGLKA